jgi:Kdo2-lipid IVA lauroyltransferase/acyltransferase
MADRTSPRLADALSSDARLRTDWRRYWIRDTLHGGIGAILHHLLRLAPIDLCSSIGARLGPVLGPLRNRSWDKRARSNVRLLRPELADADADRMVRAMWANVGRTMFEFSVLRRLYRGDRVRFVGAEHLRAVQQSGRPRVILQLHLGNWELTGALLVLQQNEPVRQFYQLPRNRFDARIAARVRKRFHEELIPPTPAGMRIARRFLAERRGSVVIAGDELVRGRVQAPTFGRPLRDDANLLFAARLAIATGAVIIPAYTVRTGGAWFEHRLEGPIEPFYSGDRDADVRTTAARLDAAITPITLKHLDQWLMLHDLRLDRD